MKRYMVFCGSSHAPQGGWLDYQGAVETIYDARVLLTAIDRYDWFQVVDSTTGLVVMGRGFNG